LATIGGNIAESVPSSDMSPVLIALDAKAVLVGPKGERTVPVHKLFVGLRETKIRKNEIIKEFILPKYGKGTKGSFQRIGRTEHDLAMANIAVRITMDGKSVKDVSIGVGMAGPCPMKAVRTENFLRENGLKIEGACEKLLEETSPRSSIRSSKEYRMKLERVLLKRALLECAGDS